MVHYRELQVYWGTKCPISKVLTIQKKREDTEKLFSEVTWRQVFLTCVKVMPY